MAETEQAHIVIDCPIETVYNFVAEPGNFRQWQPFVVEADLTSARPMRVGSSYRYIFESMGRRIETTGRITELEPNRKYSFASDSGPFPIRGGYLFEPIDQYTLLTVMGEVEPSGFFKTTKMLISHLFKKQVETSLGTLRRLLEARAKKQISH